MNPKYIDRTTHRLREKRQDTRTRTQKEFINSLEIVKDHKKIKNIRRAQGEYINTESEKRYRRNFERIFGEFKPAKGGVYKWDPRKQELVRISDRNQHGGLVTL